jgi:peptidoglycan L-alanyl-D-glutamate endopeptidase CwlK
MDTNHKRIQELKPKVQRMALDFIAKAKAEGIDLLITCGYRSPEEQDRLYAQGRTTAGKIVTNAKAGQSFHQYKVAIDICPIIAGKLAWNFDFKKLGIIGKSCGFGWGGDFPGFFKDLPHFEYTGGHTFADFKNNKIDESKFI